MDYDDYHGELLSTGPFFVCIGGDVWVNPHQVRAVGAYGGSTYVHIGEPNALKTTKPVAEVVALLTGDDAA